MMMIQNFLIMTITQHDNVALLTTQLLKTSSTAQLLSRKRTCDYITG